jgi:glycosyltransferase involved in cell wall biosynthesis
VFTRRDRAEQPDVLAWAPGVRIVNLRAGPAHPLPKDALWPHMPEFRKALLAFVARDGRGYDVIHGNFWMSGWAAVEVGQRLAVPVVQIFHAMGMTKQREQGGADTSPPERVAVERDVVRAAARLIAQCPAERDELVLDYGADPRRVAVIPSAVDVDNFRPEPRDAARRRTGLAGDGPVVVYVGRLLPRKDVGNVVRGVALASARTGRAIRLLIVGGDTPEPDPLATPEIGALGALAADLGVADRVRFTGQRQPTDLRHYYSAGDVAATTPWYEPYGLTPLEAMACGRPVVGSAVGGIQFTVQDGVTGFLVPPRDPSALAARLATLLQEPALRTTMGQAARARVEREFTWQATAQRTAALYQQALAERQESWFGPRTTLLGRDSTAGVDTVSAECAIPLSAQRPV